MYLDYLFIRVFNVIIDVLELKSAILFFCFLFVFSLLPSCELLAHFLEFRFNLFIVFLSVSLCEAFFSGYPWLL